MAPTKTILIVEDEVDLATVLQMRLVDAGFKVFTAEDAIEATAAVRKHKPDLIILDFSMPAGSGGEVYERLGQALDGAPIPPVIFLSALPLQHVMERVPAAANIRFLSKPADFNELSSTIRSLLKMPSLADDDKKPRGHVDLDLDS